MNRRQFLTVSAMCAATGIAGCLSGGEVDEVEFQSTSDDVPQEHPLHHEITIQQPYLRSDESPLTVELSVTNETDEPIVYGERRQTLGLYNVSNDFVLLPEDDDRYEFSSDTDLWITTGPIDVTADYQTAELDPSETHSETLVLVAREEDGVPETIPAEFEFNIQFGATHKDESIFGEEDYEWSFTLQQQE